MAASLGEPRNNAAPPSAEHEACLVLRDVAVAYGSKVVLSEVSADIRRGQVVGVIGPNGSGKSTLLKAILGMAPLVAGSVSVFGRSPASMRGRIAYVPQRELVDWEFPVTVFDVAMMGRYPRLGWLRRYKHNDHELVERMLERVGMLEHRHTQIGRLSGGQQH